MEERKSRKYSLGSNPESTWKVERYKNGDRHDGNYNAQGQFEGFGMYTWKRTGDVFKGNWLAGKMHGLGSFSCGKTGDKFHGTWNHGHIRGLGKRVKMDGSSTEGYFLDGKVEGLSRHVYSSGDLFLGNARSDQRDGYGVYLYYSALSSSYSGFWKQGRMEGQGRWAAQDVPNAVSDDTGDSNYEIMEAIAAAEIVKDDLTFCSSYIGEFRLDCREGNGTCSFLDGSRYSGEWKENLFHGYGRLDYLRYHYEGLFENGKRHGVGIVATSQPTLTAAAVAVESVDTLQLLFESIKTRELTVDEAFSSLESPPSLGLTFHGDFINNLPHGAGELRAPLLDGTELYLVARFSRGRLERVLTL